MRFIVGGTLAVLGVLMFASTALASSHHPKGEYADFAECPLNTPTVEECIFSVTNGGSVKIGKKTVPLVNPVTLQGGQELNAKEEAVFVGAENGVTLSKTPQPVPGGLLGITAPTWWPKFIQEWFNKQINEGFTGVTATLELAGPPSAIKINTSNLINREGTALGLPAKVKLDNAILGSNCYVGSNSSPVQVNATTGKSGTLEGAVGTVSFNPTFTIVTISGGKLVDGTFSAPGASGCGGIFSFLVDPLVNSILGTPSPSGKNSVILEGVLKDAIASAVKASE